MAFAEKRHPAYDHLDAKKRAEDRHDKQPGDPIKGAKAIYDLAVMKDPPLRVGIGSDAYKVFLRNARWTNNTILRNRADVE